MRLINRKPIYLFKYLHLFLNAATLSETTFSVVRLRWLLKKTLATFLLTLAYRTLELHPPKCYHFP